MALEIRVDVEVTHEWSVEQLHALAVLMGASSADADEFAPPVSPVSPVAEAASMANRTVSAPQHAPAPQMPRTRGRPRKTSNPVGPQDPEAFAPGDSQGVIPVSPGDLVIDPPDAVAREPQQSPQQNQSQHTAEEIQEMRAQFMELNRRALSTGVGAKALMDVYLQFRTASGEPVDRASSLQDIDVPAALAAVSELLKPKGSQ